MPLSWLLMKLIEKVAAVHSPCFLTWSACVCSVHCVTGWFCVLCVQGWSWPSKTLESLSVSCQDPRSWYVCLHHTRADLCVLLTTKLSKSLRSFVNFLVFCCFRRNIYKPYECFQGSWKTLNLVKSTIILSCGVHAVLKQKTESIINHFCSLK